MTDTTFILATIIFYLVIAIVGIAAITIWVARDHFRHMKRLDEADPHEETDQCRN